MLTEIVVAAAALVPLAAGLRSDGGAIPRGDEPCKQVGDAVNKWLSDNHIGEKTSRLVFADSVS